MGNGGKNWQHPNSHSNPNRSAPKSQKLFDYLEMKGIGMFLLPYCLLSHRIKIRDTSVGIPSDATGTSRNRLGLEQDTMGDIIVDRVGHELSKRVQGCQFFPPLSI
jgi:hypothetical protein